MRVQSAGTSVAGRRDRRESCRRIDNPTIPTVPAESDDSPEVGVRIETESIETGPLEPGHADRFERRQFEQRQEVEDDQDGDPGDQGDADRPAPAAGVSPVDHRDVGDQG